MKNIKISLPELKNKKKNNIFINQEGCFLEMQNNLLNSFAWYLSLNFESFIKRYSYGNVFVFNDSKRKYFQADLFSFDIV